MQVKKVFRPVIDMGEIPHPSGLRLITATHDHFYLSNERVHGAKNALYNEPQTVQAGVPDGEEAR